MKSRKQTQSGSIWVILLVVIAGVSAAWLYSEHRAEKRRVAMQIEQDRRDAEERSKREAERKELEKRQQEEQAQQDALSEANKKLDALLVRWNDAQTLAGTTGRIALAQPVAALQAIRRDVDELTVSPCLDEAKAHLLESMARTIEGFIAFMRNELKIGDKLAQIEFEAAADQMAEYNQARAGCSR